MQTNQISHCLLCGKPTAKTHSRNRRLNIKRTIIKRGKPFTEKTWVSIPTCSHCYKKLHPLRSFFIIASICSFVIVSLCVSYSLYLKTPPTYTTATLVIMYTTMLIGSNFITAAVLSISHRIFDELFNPSLKAMPYKDLPLTKFIKSNGFVDTFENSSEIVSIDNVTKLSILDFRDSLKETYGVN